MVAFLRGIVAELAAEDGVVAFVAVDNAVEVTRKLRATRVAHTVLHAIAGGEQAILLEHLLARRDILGREHAELGASCALNGSAVDQDRESGDLHSALWCHGLQRLIQLGQRLGREAVRFMSVPGVHFTADQGCVGERAVGGEEIAGNAA